MSFTQGLAKIKENEESRAKPTPIAMVAPELKQYMDDTEITKTCAVLGCEDSKNLNTDSFFRFPEDHNLRQIWADLTGRNNWTPTDYSYICVQHFSVDCFECDVNNIVVLNSKAVPSLKLPKHVLEVEYIDEETLDNEYEDDEDYEMESETDIDAKYEFENTENTIEEYKEEMSNSRQLTNGSVQTHTEQPATSTSHCSSITSIPQEFILNRRTGLSKIQRLSSNKKSEQSKMKEFTTHNISALKKGRKVASNRTIQPNKTQDEDNIELLKLFTEVQQMQRQAINLKERLKISMKIYKRQSRYLARLKEVIDMKKSLLSQRRKKKSRILLSLQDKMREDTNGLVLAMPTRHTDDLKNFALSVYKYSPQAYIYVRNTLRTLLPSTDVLETWVSSGYEPKNVLSNSNLIKVISELTDSELMCKVSLR